MLFSPQRKTKKLLRFYVTMTANSGMWCFESNGAHYGNATWMSCTVHKLYPLIVCCTNETALFLFNDKKSVVVGAFQTCDCQWANPLEIIHLCAAACYIHSVPLNRICHPKCNITVQLSDWPCSSSPRVIVSLNLTAILPLESHRFVSLTSGMAYKQAFINNSVLWDVSLIPLEPGGIFYLTLPIYV